MYSRLFSSSSSRFWFFSACLRVSSSFRWANKSLKSCSSTIRKETGPYLEEGIGEFPPYGWKKNLFAYKIGQYSKFFAPAAPIGTADEYSISHFFVDRSCYLKKVRRFLGKCWQKFTKIAYLKKISEKTC